MEIAFIIEMRNKGRAQSIPHGLRHCSCAFLKEKRNYLTLHIFCFPAHLRGGTWRRIAWHQVEGWPGRNGKLSFPGFGFFRESALSWTSHEQAAMFFSPAWARAGFLHKPWRLHWECSAQHRNLLQAGNKDAATCCGFPLLETWAVSWKYTFEQSRTEFQIKGSIKEIILIL